MATSAALPNASSPQPAALEVSQTLFQQFIPRYLTIPDVQRWLMTRDPVTPENDSTLSSAISYACMYYPPGSVPRGRGPYPLPQPFLDIGDFMLWHNVYHNIALGTLFNRNEEHSLAILRDSMMPGPRYSRRPKTRRFAVDLSAPNLEVMEFAWLEDDSLIIACRRLHVPQGNQGQSDLVLTGDLLFYDVIQPGCVPEIPVLRMTLNEKPSICQFCGTRGIKSCLCPSSFKRRAPNEMTTPVPFAPRPEHVPVPDPIPTGPLANVLATWHNYTQRIFTINQTGSFFVHWYKRSKINNSEMTLFMSPPHPVSYQFVCGSRKDTIRLASAYLKRMSLCGRVYSGDTRLYSYMTRGSEIGMLMDKDNVAATDQLLGISSKTSPYFQTTGGYTPDEQSIQDMFPVQSANTNPSLVTDPSGNYDYTNIGRRTIPEFNPPSDAVSCYPNLNTTQSLSAETAAVSASFLASDVTESVVLQSTLPQPAPVESTDRSHVMESNFEAWASESQTRPTAPPSQSGRPRAVLSTSSREFQQSMTLNADGTPTCKECGRSFPKKGNLARHIQTVHLKLKPFKCDQCPASFGYKTHLKRHQSVHQADNDLKCPKCNREFRGQMQLTRHIQLVHSSSRAADQNEDGTEAPEKSRILCEICGVSFSQKSNLSRHMLIHEGLRFVCPICPNKLSSFGQRYDLHRHLMRKHPEHSNDAALSLAPERV